MRATLLPRRFFVCGFFFALWMVIVFAGAAEAITFSEPQDVAELGTEITKQWGDVSHPGQTIEYLWRTPTEKLTFRVLPDGSQRSAISFWLREGEDRCAFKSHHLTIGGEEIEDSVVEFRRVTAAAEWSAGK